MADFNEKFRSFLAGMSGAELNAEDPTVVVVEQPAPKAEATVPDPAALASAKSDGVKAEQTRWATVLGHDNAQGRMTAAITLLAEPSLLSADSIVAMLPKMGTDTVTASEPVKPDHLTPPPVDPIGAATPKVEVGAASNDGSPKADGENGSAVWASLSADTKMAEGGKPKFAMRG